MKRIILTLFLLISISFSLSAHYGEDYKWGKSKWISKSYDCKSAANTWMGFRKYIDIKEVPQHLEARIAADTKYWLWINGEMVVYEGGLKRGPAPGDSYYDKVDIAPYLKPGKNLISILLWHLGQNGFSHQTSGLAALRFEAISEEIEILSDLSWEAGAIHAYKTAEGRPTNFRLPEESVLYDARLFESDWMLDSYKKRLGSAIVVPEPLAYAAMGNLVERPIPLFKTSTLLQYSSTQSLGDTIRCYLPYNCHFHPYLKIEAPSGKHIVMKGDHDIVTNAKTVHAEYISCDGVQEYESLPWINGEYVDYIVPQGVKVVELGYRESSYNCEISGHFVCDDPLLNQYWQKAARTMLVCMRDTWYDCPDRERAQWWGDEVNELNSAFYSLSPSANKLALKGIYELCAWQRNDGSIYSPIPTGNYFTELPMQMLASVGWYGFHNYYHYAADSSFVAEVYPAMRKYLHETWKLDENGLPIYREGGWDWPDAGEHNDKYAILPPWYLLALKGETVFARMLGKETDAEQNERLMDKIKESYNAIFWNGSEYKTPGHNDLTDDRVQAMAVLSGIAEPDKYEAICKVLSEQAHATTYMFCYVLEALIKMGRVDMALERMRRFYPSIMKEDCSTLYEHWNFEGTCNHAWTGSGINVLGRLIAGVDAIECGFKKFSVKPQMGDLKYIDCAFETAYGMISVKLERKGKRINAQINVPQSCQAVVTDHRGRELCLDAGCHKIRL